jgi:hypothetical protein
VLDGAKPSINLEQRGRPQGRPFVYISVGANLVFALL